MSSNTYQEWNPKMEANKSRTNVDSAKFSFNQLENPIPLEIRDIEDIHSFLTNRKYVPYAGTEEYTAHTFMFWLQSIAQLAPTLDACIKSMMSYAFGGKLTVRTLESDIFNMETENEVSDEQKRRFVNFVTNEIEVKIGKNPGDLKKLSGETFRLYKETGNAFLQIKSTESLGIRKTVLQLHPTENCLYRATKPGEAKIIDVSPKWNEAYVQKHPPESVPLYPNYIEGTDGTISTMIHLKNGLGWYGRPDWIGAFMYAYREYQDVDYLIKQVHNQFVGQIFIEVEDDDTEFNDPLGNEGAQNAGFKSVADRIEQNFTNKGKDPQSVMVMSRPFGSSPAFVFQFKPNTNENFYKVHGEINEDRIVIANSWSKRLLGKTLTYGIASNSLVDDLKVKSATVIRELHELIGNVINHALDICFRVNGITEFENIGIGYESPIDALVEELDKVNVNLEHDLNQPTTGNQTEPSEQRPSD